MAFFFLIKLSLENGRLEVLKQEAKEKSKIGKSRSRINTCTTAPKDFASALPGKKILSEANQGNSITWLSQSRSKPGLPEIVCTL